MLASVQPPVSTLSPKLAIRYGSFPEQRFGPSEPEAEDPYPVTQLMVRSGPYQTVGSLLSSMSLAAQVTIGADPVRLAANGWTRFVNQALPESCSCVAVSALPVLTPLVLLLVPKAMMANGVPAPCVL